MGFLITLLILGSLSVELGSEAFQSSKVMADLKIINTDVQDIACDYLMKPDFYQCCTDTFILGDISRIACVEYKMNVRQRTIQQKLLLNKIKLIEGDLTVGLNCAVIPQTDVQLCIDNHHVMIDTVLPAMSFESCFNLTLPYRSKVYTLHLEQNCFSMLKNRVYDMDNLNLDTLSGEMSSEVSLKDVVPMLEEVGDTGLQG